MHVKISRSRRLNLLRQKTKKLHERKRFKFFASFSILLHVFGASWVFYSMIFDKMGIENNLNLGRYMMGLDKHTHQLEYIFECWLLSIQLRYILTDCYVFYNALINHRLLKHTITIHGVEGVVCSLIFFLSYEKDCFIFGLICLGWSFMWYLAHKMIQNDNLYLY